VKAQPRFRKEGREGISRHGRRENLGREIENKIKGMQRRAAAYMRMDMRREQGGAYVC